MLGADGEGTIITHSSPIRSKRSGDEDEDEDDGDGAWGVVPRSVDSERPQRCPPRGAILLEKSLPPRGAILLEKSLLGASGRSKLRSSRSKVGQANKVRAFPLTLQFLEDTAG